VLVSVRVSISSLYIFVLFKKLNASPPLDCRLLETLPTFRAALYSAGLRRIWRHPTIISPLQKPVTVGLAVVKVNACRQPSRSGSSSSFYLSACVEYFFIMSRMWNSGLSCSSDAQNISVLVPQENDLARFGLHITESSKYNED